MILISPFSRPLRNGKNNPKNYPYWNSLIHGFHDEHIVQIGVLGEEKLCDDFRISLSLEEIKKLVSECEIWISVDNFLPHLAHHVGKSGVVLWGQSDPNIFGYKENINILKDRKCLRQDQFLIWEQCDFDEKVFVEAAEVIKIIKKVLENG